MAWRVLTITPQQRVYYGGLLLTLSLVVAFFLPGEWFIDSGIFLLGSLLLGVFLFNIRWGVYLMALFCFFSNWFIYLNAYDFARNVAYLSSVNAPLIDFIAMMVGAGVVLSVLVGALPLQWKSLHAPRWFIGLYALFILVSAVSALGAYEGNSGLSFKYLVRPIAFTFVLYGLLPPLLINSKTVLERVLSIWWGVGVGIALFGLSSLVVVPQTGWWRVTPYGINSLAPLGYNHNLIAEVLVALIPVGIWKAWEAYRENRETAPFLALGTVLMVVAELLTLSRAGWISLAVQAVVAAFLLRSAVKIVWEKIGTYLIGPLVAVGSALLLYMIFFLRSSIVSSSNFARILTTEIAAFYFWRSPLIGHGPGMYIPIFENTHEYVVEFGEALESHGFIQKVLLEQGIVGIVVFFLALIALFITIYPRRTNDGDAPHSRALAMFVMVVGAVTFQLFNTSYFTSVMWMPIGVALAARYLDRLSSSSDSP